MSYFGAKLAEILERTKLRASELSRASGINDALISRWINGQQTFVDTDDLAHIVTAITRDATIRAELIRAHLLDEMKGPGSELIRIEIRGAVLELKEQAPGYHVGLPLKLQRAVDILARESMTDTDVKNILLSMANLLQPEQMEPPINSPQEEASLDNPDKATVKKILFQGIETDAEESHPAPATTHPAHQSVPAGKARGNRERSKPRKPVSHSKYSKPKP